MADPNGWVLQGVGDSTWIVFWEYAVCRCGGGVRGVVMMIRLGKCESTLTRFITLLTHLCSAV